MRRDFSCCSAVTAVPYKSQAIPLRRLASVTFPSADGLSPLVLRPSSLACVARGRSEDAPIESVASERGEGCKGVRAFCVCVCVCVRAGGT